MILVTGGTGTVGSEVVAQLLQTGEAVRVMTRDPSNARPGANVDLAAGDLGKPETLTSAVDGIERVCSLALGSQLGPKRLAWRGRRGGLVFVRSSNCQYSAPEAGPETVSRTGTMQVSGPSGSQASRGRSCGRALLCPMRCFGPTRSGGTARYFPTLAPERSRTFTLPTLRPSRCGL